MSDYDKSVRRAADRQSVEVAKRAKLYALLTTEELRAKRKNASPWDRAAIRRVLQDRGEAE